MQQLVKHVEQKFARTALPRFKVGDLVTVNTVIREGERKRIQAFQGVVISLRGAGNGKTFTVRKISYGIGVEKTFPLSAPAIDSIKIEKHGKTRSAKLYYLRDRSGKMATKVKAGKAREQEVDGDEGEDVGGGVAALNPNQPGSAMTDEEVDVDEVEGGEEGEEQETEAEDGDEGEDEGKGEEVEEGEEQNIESPEDAIVEESVTETEEIPADKTAA